MLSGKLSSSPRSTTTRPPARLASISITRYGIPLPAGVEFGSPRRRSFTSSSSTTSESARTPLTRPSRARNRCTASRGRKQIRRRTARREVRTDIHGTRCTQPCSSQGTWRTAATGRSCAVARPLTSKDSAVADRVKGTAIPQSRCLADVRRDLAISERHGRDEWLHAVAENVDVPGAHRDPPAQRPPPRRLYCVQYPAAPRAAGRRRLPSTLTSASTANSSPARAMLPDNVKNAPAKRTTVSRAEKRSPLASIAMRSIRSGVAKVVGIAEVGTFELARRAGASGGPQVDRRFEIAAQRAGGAERRHQYPPERPP